MITTNDNLYYNQSTVNYGVKIQIITHILKYRETFLLQTPFGHENIIIKRCPFQQVKIYTILMFGAKQAILHNYRVS